MYGQVSDGLDGKYEASIAFVATVPEPNGIETKLAAVSTSALQLLTMNHRDVILKHTQRIASMSSTFSSASPSVGIYALDSSSMMVTQPSPRARC